MQSRRFIAIIKATLAVTAWGVTFVATKVALSQITPAAVVWLRFGIGLLLLGATVALRRQYAWPRGKDLVYFALLGFIGITFHQWLQSTGMVTSHATTTAWIVATTPIFMAVLGWMTLRERLSTIQAFGIGVAALGVLLVVTGGKLGTLVEGKFGVEGDFLILLSSPNWAVFSTLSRRGLLQHPPTQMMFFVMAFGWLFSSLPFIAGSGWIYLVRLRWDGWLAILFLGVCGSGLAYIFWYDALQVLPVSQVGAFVYLEPFVTVIVAAVVLGEPLVWASIVGGGGILAGVWLVSRPIPRPSLVVSEKA